MEIPLEVEQILNKDETPTFEEIDVVAAWVRERSETVNSRVFCKWAVRNHMLICDKWEPKEKRDASR
jgi:hypothetical protein